MLAAMDGFKRLFGNRILPLAAARSAGLVTVDRIPPLKHLFMRQALGVGTGVPPLARP